jgi:hypothetical protein
MDKSMTEQGKYEELAAEIGRLVDEKNKAYGNSFAEAGEFLKILYPNGIPVEAYNDALTLTRIFDKLKRIATNNDPFGEDPFFDIAGYAILGVFNNRKLKEEKKQRMQAAVKQLEKQVSSSTLPHNNSDDTEDVDDYRGADRD